MGLKCQIWDVLYETADFILAFMDLRIPQDDSDMFPRPKMHAIIGF